MQHDVSVFTETEDFRQSPNAIHISYDLSVAALANWYSAIS